MKQILIITGAIIGILIVLFDASLAYADTAPVDSQLGLSPNIGNFIIRLVISSAIGAFFRMGYF
ncbi:hypothetical protein [Aquimarina muelleri]|uniref:Uncharacterized protein n=1 Tax=Aquimarina muelleri TaxID=279356 RepID=A0A918JYQ2_9FLAO|nr:hypothetical protein [Aquimarina muelleri]MCX2765088.1 hypothetical protein [Aquimarina muelleri]GGX36347.1 hypothetical protein GCM10007384_39810 [Aquimarina muelleri]